MPAARLWRRITRHHARKRKEAIDENKRWVVTQLNVSRAITYGLQANDELPPTRAEHEQKKPNWGKIEKVREQKLEFMERHHKALSHPYYFEEYMGLANADGVGHVFEKPAEEAQPVHHMARTKEQLEKVRVEAREREQRIIANLMKYAEATGNASFQDAPPASLN